MKCYVCDQTIYFLGQGKICKCSHSHQRERSKREDPEKGMRCSELNSNIERLAEKTSPPIVR